MLEFRPSEKPETRFSGSASACVLVPGLVEQFAKSDHHTATARVEQISLIIYRHETGAVGHALLLVEQIIDTQSDPCTVQKRIFEEQLRIVAEIVLKPDIGRDEIVELQRAASAIIKLGFALPAHAQEPAQRPA